MVNIWMTTILVIITLPIAANTGNNMRYLIYFTLLFSTALSAGSIQKWVDDEGNVHYGDAPPTSAKTESVHVQPAPSNPGKALPRLGSSSENASTTTAAADDGSVPDDQAKIACDQAREDLEVINRSSRIKLRQADGSTRYLTTEEIAERKTQAEADIKSFCN